MSQVMITGPEGRIEAKYKHIRNGAPIAVIMHPHPKNGGTMNDKVTYAMYRTFINSGFNTIRFNYRGVGKSEGKFCEGEGELPDAASVLDWLQTYNPSAPACWVGGFSFGALVAMQLLMRRPEMDGFIAISPPANLYDFTFLAPCPVSGLFIQGNQDTIVTTSSVHQLAKTLTNQRHITIEEKIITGADHYFTKHIDSVMKAAQIYIRTHCKYALINTPTGAVTATDKDSVASAA